jgi:hypothetical protein
LCFVSVLSGAKGNSLHDSRHRVGLPTPEDRQLTC